MKTTEDHLASTAAFGTEIENEAVAVPGRILVVDDDADIRGVVEKLLGYAGYHVTTAEDGEKGWEVFSQGHFDLLISDHNMPRLTGLELIRRVRACQRELPVILISGRMPWDEMDLVALLQPGVALEKPFSFAELLAHIRNLLSPLCYQPANAA